VRIVIDASVALKWVLDEPDSDAAIALRDEDLIAPALWLVEAANALWRRARIGEITAAEATERLSELVNAPVALFTIEPHLDRALSLAIQIDHPVYDCIYLALALHYGTHVVTADRRFVEAVNRAGLGDLIRPLGNR
jgi:predicted nucleic acid-binding protein